MAPVGVLDGLSPHARVATAVAPFLAAVVLRLVLGRSRATGVLLSVTVVWFALNVLIAPCSSAMQRDIQSLRAWLR